MEAVKVSEEIERNMAIILEEKLEAQNKKDFINEIQAVLEKKRIVIEEEFMILNKELSFLEPMLEEADRTLQEIQRSEITELRTFTAPPFVVEQVLKAIALLLGESPDWQNVKNVIADFHFITRIKKIDKRNLSDQKISNVRDIIENDNMKPELVGKQSQACKHLCVWCLAIV